MFLEDCRKWDTYNSALISHSFDDNESPHSYFRAYGHTGDLTKLFGEDIVKEVKHQIYEKVIYLESLIEQLPLVSQAAAVVDDNHDMGAKVDMENKDIFIVHGHDNGLKNEVARFITDRYCNICTPK